MKYLTFLISMIISAPLSARGQEQPANPVKGAEIILVKDSSRVDSLPLPLKRRLLPDNLSIVERGIWDETGLVRTWGILPPLTPPERRYELGIRRTMLTSHLIGGFVTLGLMTSAVYFGQRSIDNRESRSLRNDHQTFVTLTIISYSATGLLALLSPPPSIRRDETSTTSIHKALAWFHVAGMILTPLLAPGGRTTKVDQQARFHQISAYITTATFAASMIVITF